MRLIGQLQDPEQVKRFFAYLRQQGIAAQLNRDPEGWTVWVGDENHVALARESFAGFQADPEAERYLAAESDMAAELENASSQTPTAEQVEEARRVRRTRSTLMGGLSRAWGIPIRRGYTVSILMLTLLGTVLIDFNLNTPAGKWMAFCDEPATAQGVDTLKNILEGQFWRLISPSFAYIDPRHLLFGCVFLYHFGIRIESTRGPLVLGLIILGAASFANLAQAIGPADPAIAGLAGTANFAGMSGVVYGLFGFIWAQSLRRPNDLLQMDTLTVLVLVGWQAVCILSPEWNFPNVGHIAGLMYGLIAGAMYAPRAAVLARDS